MFREEKAEKAIKQGTLPRSSVPLKMRLFAVTLGVLALPVPGIPAHVGQGLLCLPAQDLCALGGIIGDENMIQEMPEAFNKVLEVQKSWKK